MTGCMTRYVLPPRQTMEDAKVFSEELLMPFWSLLLYLFKWRQTSIRPITESKRDSFLPWWGTLAFWSGLLYLYVLWMRAATSAHVWCFDRHSLFHFIWDNLTVYWLSGTAGRPTCSPSCDSHSPAAVVV
jgi:hypothetical protein